MTYFKLNLKSMRPLTAVHYVFLADVTRRLPGFTEEEKELIAWHFAEELAKHHTGDYPFNPQRYVNNVKVGFTDAGDKKRISVINQQVAQAQWRVDEKERMQELIERRKRLTQFR